MVSQIVYMKWEQEALCKSSMVRTKLQSTWYLNKQWLLRCYVKISKDDFEFKTE